ncbi:MAG: glycosyltransferase family 4 protein [Candidatus Moranbacteria bacterium]|nr:glycosyltransferase family 4 protein [Candidatus Moranbacteria bacterium]
MSRKRIGINASFLRKLGTGVGQVTLNVLRNFDGEDTENEAVLFLEEESDLDVLNDFQTQVFLPLYKRDDLIRKILWEKFLLPKKAQNMGCEKFVSLYQCPTIFSKDMDHTMVVHDIIPKLFPEYLNNWRKKLYWSLTEKAIKDASRIVTISENTRKDLVRELNIEEEKIIVKNINIDEVYRRSIGEEEKKRILEKYNLEKGYVYSGGGMEKRKNLDSLIVAYKNLLEKNANIPPLVISGKLMPELAPLAIDVERLVDELGLEGKVRLLGFVPQEDLPVIYKSAILFVYPSLYEGFGMPVLEAMSQGVPVLASSASSIPEVGGDAVEYFDPENVQELQEKMENILNNQEERESLSERGLQRAKSFSWRGFVEELIK